MNDTKQKSLNFLTENMTRVSSANNITSDIAFILWGGPFMYITNNRGPRMD
jgi:precorrin-2 methylase